MSTRSRFEQHKTEHHHCGDPNVRRCTHGALCPIRVTIFAIVPHLSQERVVGHAGVILYAWQQPDERRGRARQRTLRAQRSGEHLGPSQFRLSPTAMIQDLYQTCGAANAPVMGPCCYTQCELPAPQLQQPVGATQSPCIIWQHNWCTNSSICPWWRTIRNTNESLDSSHVCSARRSTHSDIDVPGSGREVLTAMVPHTRYQQGAGDAGPRQSDSAPDDCRRAPSRNQGADQWRGSIVHVYGERRHCKHCSRAGQGRGRRHWPGCHPSKGAWT